MTNYSIHFKLNLKGIFSDKIIMDVRDLYNIYESINRDIAKLKTTRSSIPVDREYSSVLQNTITSEIEKFENLKKLILELEVEIPDDFKTVEKQSVDYTDPSFFPMV
ncbi:MAG: hypothetical protein KBA66_16590 [Leptospiraceae bacterium]|nr:hypothetical protein [Leptospiraceae bacterium]